MSNQEVMAVQPQQFNQSDLDLLKRTIAPGTTNDQFDLFVQICQRVQLDPFARQIYCILRMEYNRETRMKEPKMTVTTSIDGYRLLAQRSGEYEGQDGPYWYDAEREEWTDVWVKDTPPAAAKIGVLRKGFKNYLYATARFESYVARSYNTQTQKYDGAPMNLWAKMPEVMIAKVAEALALRRAFPAELSGIYPKEEMDQAGEPLPMVSVQPVQPAQDTGNAVEVPAEVVDESTPPTPADKPISLVKKSDTKPLVDDAIKARLESLLTLGQTHGQFKKWIDLAEYATKVLGRPVHVKQLAQLPEADLVGVESALLSEVGDEQEQAS